VGNLALRSYALNQLDLSSAPTDFEILNAVVGEISSLLDKPNFDLPKLHEIVLICDALLPDLSRSLNEEQLLAFLVSLTRKGPLLITGNAGTGKSHLLRNLSEFFHGIDWNIAVVAPTGIAAINVAGMTIHRLFRLHTHRVLEEKPGSAENNHGFPVGGFQKGHEPLLKALDFLVIDEVSMVRADVLDAIDRKLRHSRRINRVFGGVPVVFFGDFLQLPPVQDTAWKFNARRAGYSSPYAISSKVLSGRELRVVELTHNVRVSNGVLQEGSDDARYVEILGRMRKMQLLAEDLEFLNSNCVVEKPNEDNLQIRTKNEEVDFENSRRLSMLTGQIWKRSASMTGRFLDRAADESFDGFPADKEVKLKKGARVMFIKNDDQNHSPRWANGSLGTVTAFLEEGVQVALDSGPSVKVGRSTWELVRYEITKYRDENGNEQTSVEIKPDGYFKQYPLRLAWAVTIHKSQGQTFDSITVDLGQGVWEPGQTYVALSRVTSLRGLELVRPLRESDLVRLDPVVGDFLDAETIKFTREQVLYARDSLMRSAEEFFGALAPEDRNSLNFQELVSSLAHQVAAKRKISFEAAALISASDPKLSIVASQGHSETALNLPVENYLEDLVARKEVSLLSAFALTLDEPETTIITSVFKGLFPGLPDSMRLLANLNRHPLTSTPFEGLDYPARRTLLLQCFRKGDCESALLLLAQAYAPEPTKIS
jgi:hypothetical protein